MHGGTAFTNELSETENADFKRAVTAVKNKDYPTALGLFEIQAKNARHDAQYNMAQLLHAGKGRPEAIQMHCIGHGKPVRRY